MLSLQDAEILARVSNIIFCVSLIIVCVITEKEILNELNSTEVEILICKY